MGLPTRKERETLPVSKLPTEINELQDAVLLGDFANGSPEWHSLRNEPGAVGGSDIAAIAGLSTWESAITKWAKKTGQIPDEVQPNMSMKLGTKLEAPILELFADEHPELEIYETGTWANKMYDWARANLDGLYKDADGNWGIIEVKFSRDYWTQVPQSYRAQVLWYMKVFRYHVKKVIQICCLLSSQVAKCQHLMQCPCRIDPLLSYRLRLDGCTSFRCTQKCVLAEYPLDTK